MQDKRQMIELLLDQRATIIVTGHFKLRGRRLYYWVAWHTISHHRPPVGQPACE